MNTVLILAYCFSCVGCFLAGYAYARWRIMVVIKAHRYGKPIDDMPHGEDEWERPRKAGRE
jgi:hypothetical protein